jgi:transcription elongation factor Elf1
MPKQDITCDNCGSMYVLSYDESEVSYSAAHCPFCGDFFDTKSDELDFNDDGYDYDTVDEEVDLEDEDY